MSTVGTVDLTLTPIDLASPHALSRFFGTPPLTAGRDVDVAVVDTGWGWA